MTAEKSRVGAFVGGTGIGVLGGLIGSVAPSSGCRC